MDSKEQLNQAFRLMRKAGLVARQNFSCCGSCAGAEIATDVTEMSAEKRAKVKGCVFYHRQDGADMREGTYLSYGQIGTQKHGPVGMDTLDVGRLAVECLAKAGLQPEWNEDASTRIWVPLA